MSKRFLPLAVIATTAVPLVTWGILQFKGAQEPILPLEVVLEQPPEAYPAGSLPRLLLVPRRLYASGFTARDHVSYVLPSSTVWRWTRATEEELGAFYDASQRGGSCEPGRFIVMRKEGWGLASRMRDATDTMLQGLAENKTVVFGTEGYEYCPWRRWRDRFMHCFFDAFSSCETPPVFDCEVDNSVCVSWSPDIYLSEGLEPLWQRLLAKGLHREDVGKAPEAKCRWRSCPREVISGGAKEMKEVYECREKLFPEWKKERQVRLAVLRSLLAKHVFRPSQEVLERKAEMGRLMGRVRTPMLIVHARRTDKKEDDPIDGMMPQELASGHNETLLILARLVAAAERLAGTKFRSIYFLSDNIALSKDIQALSTLSLAAALRPPVLRSPFDLSGFMSSAYLQKGHQSLSESRRVDMNSYLLAEIFWAIEHATYIVGNGRSGVSQFMAQMLGAKHRTDPNWLGLWEEDETMLRCLPETRDIPFIVERAS